jgi:hypothetical protein
LALYLRFPTQFLFGFGFVVMNARLYMRIRSNITGPDRIAARSVQFCCLQ